MFKLQGNECNENTYLSASIVEILHVATLLHDDVVDESDLRRGGQPYIKYGKIN